MKINFIIKKLLNGFLDFEAAVQLQIEVKQKMLGRSNTLGVKSVKECSQRGTLKNLTTPIEQPLVVGDLLSR